jgi:recombination protein RecR
MSATPASVINLIEQLSRLPGIGPKTASRLTYFLLRAPDEQSLSLAQALQDLKALTRFCSTCFNITDADSDPCPICRDEHRDPDLLLVVEEPLDVLAMERTRYRGRYHVLHGAISPVEGIGPQDLKVRELLARVEQHRPREIIIATNPSLEGESTAMYLQRQLAPLGIKVTRLARGLPVGADLEYADDITLAHALEGRQDM